MAGQPVSRCKLLRTSHVAPLFLSQISRAQSLPNDCESSALIEPRELRISAGPCCGLSVAVLASNSRQDSWLDLSLFSTYTHRYLNMWMYTRVSMHTHLPTHRVTIRTRTRRDGQAQTQTHKETNKQMNKHTHKLKNTPTHAHAHTCIHTRTHRNRDKHGHKHSPSHRQTHTLLGHRENSCREAGFFNTRWASSQSTIPRLRVCEVSATIPVTGLLQRVHANSTTGLPQHVQVLPVVLFPENLHAEVASSLVL